MSAGPDDGLVATTKWNRDYRATNEGARTGRGLWAPRRRPGEISPSGFPLSEFLHALFRVSLFFHLSARAFRPDWCSTPRSDSSMIAETTENLTLPRAHVPHDSPRFSGLALRHPLWSAKWIFPYLTGCFTAPLNRMQYAIFAHLLDHSLTSCVSIRYAAFLVRGIRGKSLVALRAVIFCLRFQLTCALINCYINDYSTVNDILQ
jgi:hypothetical protein